MKNALLGILLVVGGVAAQAVSRHDPRLLALFAGPVEKAAGSTVRVYCQGRPVALGTVVGADGWIVTKASELKGRDLVCKLPDGRELEARKVAGDDNHDLALLRVEATDLKPVAWADSKLARPGRWVASVGPGKTPVAVGVVSVATRDLTVQGAAPPSPTSGYLGVGLDLEFAGVKLHTVGNDGPARRAGLKPGDQIVALNGTEVENGDDFLALLQTLKPGDTVALTVVRDDKEQEIKLALGKRPRNTRSDMQNSWGSTLSERRTGFPRVLQHDSVLKPADCGGPLVDLDGKVVGLNIARAGRTESYAVPAEVARDVVEALKKAR